MSDSERTVWLNGQFLPRSQAKLDIEDRGAMFADGVYEVTRYYGGRPFALAEHIARLRHSLAQIHINEPAEVARLADISGELLRRNGMSDAIVYWQITRGSAPPEARVPDRREAHDVRHRLLGNALRPCGHSAAQERDPA